MTVQGIVSEEAVDRWSKIVALSESMDRLRSRSPGRKDALAYQALQRQRQALMDLQPKFTLVSSRDPEVFRVHNREESTTSTP